MRLVIGGAVGAALAVGFVGAAGRGADAGPLPPGSPTRIVYVCGADLCQVRPDGSGRRRVTFDGRRGGAYSSPSLSRNGLRLAFVRNGRVWLAGLSPAGARALAPRPPEGDTGPPRAQQVRLRPDGEQLAVFERRWLRGDVGSPTRVYVTSWAGTTLSERPALSPSAAWGPGDELMDFGYAVEGEGHGPGGTSLICLRQAGDDLHCARILARGDLERDLRQPALSPDGRLLAVLRHEGRESSSSGTAIVLFDVATGRPVRTLTSGLVLANPTWSPDGRYIVFTAPRPVSRSGGAVFFSGTNLRVVAADGRSASRVVAAGSSPAWGGLPRIVE